jgi:hypothetical protein
MMKNKELGFKIYNALLSSKTTQPNVFVFGALVNLLRICDQHNQIFWILEEMNKFHVIPDSYLLRLLINCMCYLCVDIFFIYIYFLKPTSDRYVRDWKYECSKTHS